MNKHTTSLIFPSLLLIAIIFYVIEYVLLQTSEYIMTVISPEMELTIAIIFSIWYIASCRKENILCFELMFLSVYILSVFYSDIVFSSVDYIKEGVGGALLNAVTQQETIQKSRIIQMMALYIFLFGCVLGNRKKRVINSWKKTLSNSSTNYKIIIYIIVSILLLEIALDIHNGTFMTWFSYKYGIYESERNLGLGHITALCMMSTIVEFIYLGQHGIKTFNGFIHSVNKIFVVEILFISCLLIISGNRNEMLMIFLPFIICYNVFIKKIPNKYIFIGIIVGIIFMVYSGLTRLGDSLDVSDLDLYLITRDYSIIDINCTYLVKYTDEHSPHMFITLFGSILGGIPYIGPMIFNTLGLSMDTQSTYITTAGLAAWNDTGLGTSLVGDLYYNAKLPFVCFFMFGWGYFISRLYNRFVYEKNYSLPLLILYVYMTANAVYFVRQQWDFPLHEMLYSYIMLVCMSYFIKSNRLKY